MQFNDYIFRSHMVGNIVSVPKPLTKNQSETLSAYRERVSGVGKPLTAKMEKDWHSLEDKFNRSNTYKLSDGQKKLLAKIAFDERYGRKTKLSNPFLEKGIEVEKDSRDLMSRVLGKVLIKDDERKSNAWVTGKRDIKDSDVIFDIKSTWSYDTFNSHLEESAVDLYLRQGDCYMELWDIRQFILCFVLVDTPIRLIDGALRKADYSKDLFKMSGEVSDLNEVKKVLYQHIFTKDYLHKYCMQSQTIHIEMFDDFVEIPEEARVHMVPHAFDPIRIEQRNECIKMAREYMNTVKPINNIIKQN